MNVPCNPLHDHWYACQQVVALQPTDIKEDRLMMKSFLEFCRWIEKTKNGEEKWFPYFRRYARVNQLTYAKLSSDKQFIFYGPKPTSR